MDDNVGAAITGAYQHPVLHDNLLIEIAGSDALSPCITVYVLYRV
jgi:hypothetical protein